MRHTGEIATNNVCSLYLLKFNTKRLIITITTLFFYMLLYGCASSYFYIKVVPPEEKVDIETNEVFIFGKIILIENNKEKAPYGFLNRPSPTLFHLESGKYSWTMVEKDGSFYWKVPKGAYIIPKVQYGDLFFQPHVAFWASSSADVIYLGTLKIAIMTKGTLFKSFKGVKSVTIIDEFDMAKENLLNRNPDLSADIEKRLMIHDNTLPTDLTNREEITEFFLILGTMP